MYVCLYTVDAWYGTGVSWLTSRYEVGNVTVTEIE
jgi:hypothetical protein